MHALIRRSPEVHSRWLRSASYLVSSSHLLQRAQQPALVSKDQQVIQCLFCQTLNRRKPYLQILNGALQLAESLTAFIDLLSQFVETSFSGTPLLLPVPVNGLLLGSSRRERLSTYLNCSAGSLPVKRRLRGSLGRNFGNGCEDPPPSLSLQLASQYPAEGKLRRQ